LRTVENARNLNRVRLDLIDNDVRQRCKCKFTPPGHAAAGSSEIGEILKTGALVIDRPGNAAGRFGIVPFNPFADVLLIFGFGYPRPGQPGRSRKRGAACEDGQAGAGKRRSQQCVKTIL